MITNFVLLLLLILSNTFAESVSEQPIKGYPIPTDPRICTRQEKQPGFCTLVYKPVCGVYLNQQGQQVKQTFSNRCAACKSANVEVVYDKPCSSYPINSQFCIPYPNALVICSELYEPVCGYYNKSINCLVAPCADTYPNDCFACLYDTVDYYVPGECKSQVFNDELKNSAKSP